MRRRRTRTSGDRRRRFQSRRLPRRAAASSCVTCEAVASLKIDCDGGNSMLTNRDLDWRHPKAPECWKVFATLRPSVTI